MPETGNAARAWMDREEAGDRKNARVIDRVRLAIPRELTREQRLRLVQAFCSGITGDRVPWFAAIHQDGDDVHNPHAHIVVRDRDVTTGKRVLRWSDSARDRKAAGMAENAVDAIRAQWEHHANQALEEAGSAVRIDRRSLEALGIDRDPTIHVGPRALHVDEYIHRPQSKIRTERRGGRARVVDYPMIDAGRTRKERHAEIIDINLERDARSPDLPTRVRAQLQREQLSLDRNLEREVTVDMRRFTLEERRIRAAFVQEDGSIRAEFLAKRQEIAARFGPHLREAVEAQKTEHAAARRALLLQQKAERDALHRKQAHWAAWLARLVDFSGSERRKAFDERAALAQSHKDERVRLIARQKQQRAALSQAYRTRGGQIVTRHERERDEKLTEAARRRDYARARLDERRADALAKADVRRQLRAADREQAELRLEEQIRGAAARRGWQAGMTLGHVVTPSSEQPAKATFNEAAGTAQHDGHKPDTSGLQRFRRSGPSQGLER